MTELHQPADYRDDFNPLFRGNPLIEALPEMLERRDFLKRIGNRPEYDESMRSRSARQRSSLLYTALESFQPLSRHWELGQEIDDIIRWGYFKRNPIEFGYMKKMEASASGSVHPQDQYVQTRDLPEDTAKLGKALIGISGGGKSRFINQSLSYYPQVILHSEYPVGSGQKWPWQQITYLKIDCPYDASIKALCISFFRKIDDLLGTSYESLYVSPNTDPSVLVTYMVRLSFLHSIGVLIIDEVQNLAKAKNSDAGEMLQFFVQLTNANIPLIIVGTPLASEVFKKEMALIRRLLGPTAIWEPLPNNREWEQFTRTIWLYQYLEKPVPLDTPLVNALHHYSAGIPAIAVRLYITAQARSMGLKDRAPKQYPEEVLTPELIKQVYFDRFGAAHPMLEALRRGDKALLKNYPDLNFDDLKSIQGAIGEELRGERKGTAMGVRSDTLDNNVASGVRPMAQTVTLSRGEQVGKLRADSIPTIVEAAQKERVSSYDALRENGYILSVEAFL